MLFKLNFTRFCHTRNLINRRLVNNVSNCRPPKPTHSLSLLDANKIKYQSTKDEFCSILAIKAPRYFFMDKKSINPFPMLVSKSQINEYNRIQEALCCAIQVVVLNYFNDKRIQNAFNLNENVKNILELYRPKPTYKIGSLKFYSNSKLFGLLFSFYGLKILKKLI